jgi:hypothetical protein
VSDKLAELEARTPEPPPVEGVITVVPTDSSTQKVMTNNLNRVSDKLASLKARKPGPAPTGGVMVTSGKGV